uniref:Reverse transcriptase N-terminal domain-containing protein n=1 Tax=Gelidium elegans TaxID=37200 RepID=A0A141SDF2_GELEL|nr:hypothetical protein Gele_060 [Gelidium elegans]AMK96320.1 hypothetical protein Gele_060 [Gelidium elegans]
MFNYNLKSYKSWNSLPWKQINERIFILQNKIYKASQECNQKDLKHSQSILINSIEAKLKCIDNISQFIYQYYLRYNSEIYDSTELCKKSILIYLLSKEKPYNCYIIDKVKENIIYLSIQPEWKAKLEPNASKYVNYFALKALNCRPNNYGRDKFCSIFTMEIYTKHININYLLAKIQSSLQVNSTIKDWVKNQSIMEPPKWFCRNPYTIINSCYDLYQSICSIIYCGMEWFNLTKVFREFTEYRKIQMVNVFIANIHEFNILYIIKNDSIFDDYYLFFKSVGLILKLIKSNLQYVQYIYENKNYILRSYAATIKKNIYRKDFLDRIRPNTKLNFIKCINKIKNSFRVFHEEYNIYFTDADFVKLCKMTDSILNSWLRKKYKGQKKIKYTINLIKTVGSSRMK